MTPMIIVATTATRLSEQEVAVDMGVKGADFRVRNPSGGDSQFGAVQTASDGSSVPAVA